MRAVRVAYTLEQCWHRVPGGTAVAALEAARALQELPDLELIGVAGRHRGGATDGFEPPIKMQYLPCGGPLLYESWLRLSWPKVESVVDAIDLVHATTIIAPATTRPLVVTLHDLAFLHHPEFFTARGNKVFRRSLNILKKNAVAVLCSSRATMADCIDAGFSASLLHHVPLGVREVQVRPSDVQQVRTAYSLPTDYLLFVGTLEPRKNLTRLVQAHALMTDPPPLVIVGAPGWGDVTPVASEKIIFLGHIPAADLVALYAGAQALCYPSIMEGFGLPILEAMMHGTPVLTSRGTSTEEVAGTAAVLVDPLDIESIANGLRQVLARHDELSHLGRVHAATMSWQQTAALTHDVYSQVLAL
ncbi:MAG: glycosyltransferase family 1 protein [Ilumatobacteraceae bacterium]|nr:glycosyltransferase family 1 protein [Ilumatobacteraceae bacterium]